MLDDDAVHDAARRSREPIRQLSLQYPDMTIEDAYRVQRALVAVKLAEGRTVKARKIGLTSRAMQQAVSITEPDYGVIFDDMFFDDGGIVPYDEILPPGQVILSGSFTRPVFAGAGDVIHADFGDLGAVTCRFR